MTQNKSGNTPMYGTKEYTLEDNLRQNTSNETQKSNSFLGIRLVEETTDISLNEVNNPQTLGEEVMLILRAEKTPLSSAEQRKIGIRYNAGKKPIYKGDERVTGFTAYDAKALNTGTHQGRGDCRYITDGKGTFIGIAEHNNDGSYRLT